ncbi:hypothetical protein T12_14198 [Trichinella patagoniensis]|uniref:Uncharacterized protein n=1 Tax=Trichinella patagoniensis TaxID=990121 RepID=A0A0V0ZA99_9BILA|nr:hypothetical protein T12_14198 [Trichinella patagoniensis]
MPNCPAGAGACSILTYPFIVHFSLFKSSLKDALCKRDLGITETTASVSKSKETIVPFSLPFTNGVLPACSPAMINTLRFHSPPLCVPVGCRWFRRLS